MKVVLVVLAVFLLYQGVMYFVRRHVDQLVAQNTGQQLQDFELTDLSGKVWNVEAIAGRKAVFNFFRSHCQMCRVEAATMRAFAGRVDPEKVIVFGVMMDEIQGYGIETTKRTLIELDYRHPVCMANEEFLDGFHGRSFPHVTPITYVADANGRITASLRGHQRLDVLEAAVGADALLSAR